MAITVTQADQLAATARNYPIDRGGKLRFLYAKFSPLAAQADIGSTLVIGTLPAGRVRILPFLSRYKNSAAAAATMQLGHDGYTDTSTPNTDTGEPANAAAFGTGINLAAAGDAAWPNTSGIKYDMYSLAGVPLKATLQGANVALGATFEFLVAYVAD